MQELGGTRIDRYDIEAEIGRGGMSRVYRAHDPGLGRDVALKVLLPEITGDEASVARFLREARAAAKLDHPNIVPIYDTGQDDGSYFIAMKLIEGRTMRAVLGERALSLAEVGDYLQQIASALDYAHERGIVHRDIKPENIMLDAAGTVTLTDFGIANLADEMSVTRTGAVVGTPVYMAPEHLRGELATARSDIYGLGVLAYELLSGASPFAGRTPYAVMLAQIDEQPEPVHQRRPDVPVEASRVIDRALEKDPVQRQATPGEFARQFVDALGERRDTPPVAIAMPGRRLSGTAAVTISSSVSPLAGRVTAAPTQVSGAATGMSTTPVWRVPWLRSLLGAGLLLAVMVAGVSAFRDSQTPVSGEEDPAFLPLSGTPTHEPTPENTAETEVAIPVAQPARDKPSDEERRPATPEPTNTPDPTSTPEPTATVVEQVPADPPVEPVPTEVVDEQPADTDSHEDGDEDEGGPPANPGNAPEKQDEEKPDNSSQDNEHKDEKEKEKDDDDKKKEKDEKQEDDDEEDDD